MSAVADFIEDTFDAVGDVFEAVGDVVEDVVDFVGEAVEKVGDVVQAVLDDPLPVLLSIAGTFVGIPPYVTSGIITGARGGDLGDIALSMGTSYLGSSAGASITNSISSTVSSTFIDAGVNETFAQVASDSITKGLVNGTIAEVRGGSFEDGFAGGFTGSLVSGGVSQVASYVQPDIVALAMDSGLDLNQATSFFNAGVKAVSAGVTSEVTGQGDFVTSFTNSAIVSSVDAGTRTLNTTIDQQFNTAATGWNDTGDDGEKVDTTITGAGIPNDVVTQVAVSNIGVDNTPDTNIIDTNTNNTSSVANVLASSTDTTDTPIGETATSNISTLPETPLVETPLAQAPTGETVTDFTDIISTPTPTAGSTVVASATDDVIDVPESVIDIAENLTEVEPQETVIAESTEPKGGLTTMAQTPIVDLDTSSPAVISEAPVAENLLTTGLAAEQPIGGLNAVSQTSETTPEAKMATSMGLKPTDITKPIVATVGSLLKQSLNKQKRPAPRAPVRPAGGLQMAGAKTAPRKAAPPRMDVAKLIPIQKAAPIAPPQKLASTAKLSPVTNIAGLTSLVKKTG